MVVYVDIAVPDTSGYRFDPPTFAGWVRECWPETEIHHHPERWQGAEAARAAAEADGLAEHWPKFAALVRTGPLARLTYTLPSHPIDVLPDPTVPDGLRWMPVLALAHDPAVPGGVRQLSSLSMIPTTYTLGANLTCLWIDGGRLLDYAIAAVWLRAKVPPEIPLSLRWLGERTEKFVIPGDIGVEEVIRRYFASFDSVPRDGSEP